MTDVTALRALAAKINAKTSPNVSRYAIAQAAATVSQEAEIAALTKEVEMLKGSGMGTRGGTPPPPETPPGIPNDLGAFGAAAPAWGTAGNWMTDSSTKITQMLSVTSSAVVAISGYGAAIYTATAGDPTVTITDGGYTPLHLWGTVQDHNPHSMQCPAGALPANGSDGHLSVIQPDGTMWEAWKAVPDGSNYLCSALCYADVGDYSYVGGSCRGSSFTNVSGVILPSEVAAGEIPHSLCLVLPTGAVSASYVWPSTMSDGVNSGDQYIPEGARICLDPATSLAGLSTLEQLIGQALKSYGMILADKAGGTEMSFQAQDPRSWTSLGQTDQWATLGYSSYPSLAGLRARFTSSNLKVVQV